MPFRKLSTTLPTRMLDILKRGHQVRDTSKTATEAENSSPATIPRKKKKRSTIKIQYFQLISMGNSNLLRSPTTNRLNTSHLPLSTNRTINRTRCRLYTVQRDNRGITTRMARRRVVLLRVTLELCLRLRLRLWILGQGLARVRFLGGSSHYCRRVVCWCLADRVGLVGVLFF